MACLIVLHWPTLLQTTDEIHHKLITTILFEQSPEKKFAPGKIFTFQLKYSLKCPGGLSLHVSLEGSIVDCDAISSAVRAGRLFDMT